MNTSYYWLSEWDHSIDPLHRFCCQNGCMVPTSVVQRINQIFSEGKLRKVKLVPLGSMSRQIFSRILKWVSFCASNGTHIHISFRKPKYSVRTIFQPPKQFQQFLSACHWNVQVHHAGPKSARMIYVFHSFLITGPIINLSSRQRVLSLFQQFPQNFRRFYIFGTLSATALGWWATC